MLSCLCQKSQWWSSIACNEIYCYPRSAMCEIVY